MRFLLFFIIFLFFSNFSNSSDVNFHAWGGSIVINNFISESSKDLKKININLKHTKVPDIADTVKILESDKKNNNFGKGLIDLMWINGENFHRLKKKQLLFGPINTVENYKYINFNDQSLHNDFGEPVEGMEVPWGRAQFVIIYDSDLIHKPPETASELMAFAKNNPGRITYPQIPEFHGTTFLKQIIYELIDNKSILQKPISKCQNTCNPLHELINYLKELHPFLWNEGRRFPKSVNETIPLLSNREIWLTFSFNPSVAANYVKNGDLRKSTRTTSFRNGSIGNTHYLAIPFNSSNKKSSLKVINYLISPTIQAKKANINNWGDPTVLDFDLMNSEQRQMFLKKQNIHILPKNKIPYIQEPHYSWTEAIENEWFKAFN
ncbi:MAG: ABC transporter substrate-binding protein [Pelagibacteraceae bacterium]|nr:ABC transporter substrate-binding protein [Pelagibacteraceae bacterium]|tara:strand:- start:553 stop:1689 length:1137 start_codon:yes stop_codon:yes gene_type:complete